MTTPKSFDWVREISPDLKKLDSIPLTGSPPFPWEELSAKLSQTFERELTIKPGETTWRKKEDLLTGLGDTPYPLTLTIPSLRGQVCWVMPAQEIEVLAALLLTKDPRPLTFHDPSLNESFYRFLALEVLHHLTQIDNTLTPILSNHSSLPSEDSLCKDISLLIDGETLWGRLMIHPEFRTSWVEHFAQQSVPSEIGQLIETTVHLEAGKCQMTPQEWKSINLGDFLLLDSCTLETEHFDGKVLLTINGHPTFRAKLKDGTLKILELPLSHEVETPMAKEDEFNDLDLPEEDSFEEDLFSEESEIEEEVPEKLTTVQETPLFSPEQLPLNLVIEVGRIQMSVDQLMKLEPGNMLETDIHPENGVNLTVQGKVVGKGELIRIGEAIGVRITQLGRAHTPGS